MLKLLKNCIEKIKKWKAKRRHKKMLKEACKNDPFIYD